MSQHGRDDGDDGDDHHGHGNGHDDGHGHDHDGHDHDGHDHDGHDHDGHDHDGHDHDHDGHDHDHDGHDHDAHHHHDIDAVGVGVVTVSTSRTLDDDPAGDAIASAFADAGHEVVTRDLVPDDHDRVQSTIETLATREDVDAVVTTGGTGVTPDDVTVEAASALFDKTLPGFGELFRRLSYDEIGTKVVGTRAVAGIVDGTPTFCLPGSENAATLGAGDVIVPEVGHLAGLARRDGEAAESHGHGDGEAGAGDGSGGHGDGEAGAGDGSGGHGDEDESR